MARGLIGCLGGFHPWVGGWLVGWWVGWITLWPSWPGHVIDGSSGGSRAPVVVFCVLFFFLRPQRCLVFGFCLRGFRLLAGAQ